MTSTVLAAKSLPHSLHPTRHPVFCGHPYQPRHQILPHHLCHRNLCYPPICEAEKWCQSRIHRTRHTRPHLRMCSGGHQAPCGTLTTTQRPQKHTIVLRLQQKMMVQSAHHRYHVRTIRCYQNNWTPSWFHTRRRQHALNAGRQRYGPPHGAR